MHVLGRSFLRILRLVLIIGIGIGTLVLSAVALEPAGRNLTRAASFTDADVELPTLGGSSIMYDRFGHPLASFQAEKQNVIPLEQVPTTVVEAVLAVEDSGFYRHGPVDARSILRAARTNVDSGGAQQGGSTITQQVIKQTITGSKRTLQRKLSEARLATQLEKELTKDQILERYLNIIYLGHNSYGVQAAAQTYWGVDVGKLDWAQAALLAGMIRNPNGYDPIAHPVAARRQRSLALERLVKTGRLTQKDADKSAGEPLPKTLHATAAQKIDEYFVQEVEDRLLNRQGTYNRTSEGMALGKTPKQRYNAFYRGGLRIYTTFDPTAEAAAVAARQSSNLPGGMRPDGTFWLPDYYNPANGVSTPVNGTMSIVSVEPATGAVRTLLGGPGLRQYQNNIATNRFGQTPGSSFKTFVLTTAFSLGYVPSDLIDGSSPCSFPFDDPDYINPAKVAGMQVPPLHNFGGEGGGVETLTAQTTGSVNCAFARLGQVVGLRNVAKMARAMGLTNCEQDVPTYGPRDATCFDAWNTEEAFGGAITVIPLDMADAYATLANDGVHNDAYFVDRIEDRTGHVIWAHQARPSRAMSVQTARLVTQVLRQNVLGGTGTAAQLPSGQPSAGKTGTTDGATNIWFVGYTPQLATAVWIGSEGQHQMPIAGGGATGGVYAAYTWREFMSAVLQGPSVPFPDAAPTRQGFVLQLGPDNGLPATLPAALEAKLRSRLICGPSTSSTPDGVDIGGTAPTSCPADGSTPTTVPGNGGTGTTGGGPGATPTSTAPPITSYPPR